MNDRLPHGSNYTGIKAPTQSDGSYYQAQLLSDGRFRIAKNTGGLFGNWNDFLTNADLVSGYTESIDVQANSYTETTITHNMGVVPNIIVSLRALTGQIDRADALTALIQEVTSNTATVRVFNSGTAQSGVNLYWIALRK